MTLRRFGSWRCAVAITVAGLAISPALTLPSYAATTVDTYPGRTAVCAATGRVSGWCVRSIWKKYGVAVSPRGYSYRNCTDYAAWRANKLAGRTVVPRTWGNANSWDEHARAAHLPVSGMPHVGDIAQSDATRWGHVAIVAEVGTGARAGRIRIAELNWAEKNNRGVLVYDGLFHNTRWIPTRNYEYIRVS